MRQKGGSLQQWDRHQTPQPLHPYHNTDPGGKVLLLHKKQLNAANLPTHALCSVDTVNMFHEMSQEECRKFLIKELPEHVPIFDAKYRDISDIWCQLPKGDWLVINQAEGHLQGDQWSRIFSILVLYELLTRICTKQKGYAAVRAERGKYTEKDDKVGGAADPIYFIDDGNILLPLPDVKWYFNTITRLGHKCGFKCNKEKCDLSWDHRKVDSPLYQIAPASPLPQ